MKMSKLFTVAVFCLLFLPTPLFASIAQSEESNFTRKIQAEYPNEVLSACEVDGLNKVAAFQNRSDSNNPSIASAEFKKILIEAKDETCQVNITYFLVDSINKLLNGSYFGDGQPRAISKQKIANALRAQLPTDKELNLKLDDLYQD